MAEKITERSCKNCALAQWQKTTNGKRHPNGSGQCLWKIQRIPVAAAFGSQSFQYKRIDEIPQPQGGYIDYKEPYINCPTFQEINDLQ